MCIIKYSLVCEVAQIATSTLFSLTKKSFLTVCEATPSLCVFLSLGFLAVSQLCGGSLAVLIMVKIVDYKPIMIPTGGQLANGAEVGQTRLQVGDTFCFACETPLRHQLRLRCYSH